MNVKPEHLEVFRVHTVRTPSATTEPSHIHIPRPSRVLNPVHVAEAEGGAAPDSALEQAA